ncbi:sensor histidine kinase [Longitalea arenae]|uniref:sensor histidine kinase n=1 Tax=Longitalea arenae TaxID=2812558 RepID=UPI0019680496|nr:ATP-binding protein [Longitalea arenae]
MPGEQHTIIVFIVVTTLFILILISFIVFILFLYQRRQISYQKGLEILKSDFEKTLLTTQLEIQEQTFQNISREIHDNIGLSLTLAKLNLNTIDWKDANSPPEKVNGSIHFISRAIEDLSYISKALHTDFIEENGLLKALELEIGKIQKLGIYNIRYDVTGSPVYMQTQKELVIFRIIQEVLNNCIKHAEATAITLLLNYQSDFVDIELSDNGKGFARRSAATGPGKGTGLMNIVKRAAFIDGSCQVNSFPGKGTAVHLKIPY